MAMNYENLHTLIDRYEANLDKTMGPVHHEQFKWIAVKTFHNAWFAPGAMERPFSELFKDARKDCGWLIDNSRMSATSGVIKIAEQDQEAVKALFLDLQSISEEPDLRVRRDRMIAFGDGIEALRQKYYPRNWKYKHYFHDATCYLTFFAPEQNFIYRYKDAKPFIEHVGYEKPLGSGWHIDLAAYYELCNIVVAALREHPSLLEKHRAKLEDACYLDDSLHLMAFDLMYCCQCYNYYWDMAKVPVVRSTASAAKARTNKAQQELAEKREAAQKHLEELQTEMAEAESQLADLEEVSLIGVEVTTDKYGTGTVTVQQDNAITVQFSDLQVNYRIHRSFKTRPAFEDDEEIVNLLSDRADLQEKIKSLSSRIAWA